MILKTLKDLEVCESDEDKSPTENVEWFKVQLKQEAIKWVKEEDWSDFIGWLRFERNLSDEAINNLSQEEFTQLFIEYFFNITEEDLK